MTVFMLGACTKECRVEWYASCKGGHKTGTQTERALSAVGSVLVTVL